MLNQTFKDVRDYTTEIKDDPVCLTTFSGLCTATGKTDMVKVGAGYNKDKTRTAPPSVSHPPFTVICVANRRDSSSENKKHNCASLLWYRHKVSLFPPFLKKILRVISPPKINGTPGILCCRQSLPGEEVSTKLPENHRKLFKASRCPPQTAMPFLCYFSYYCKQRLHRLAIKVGDCVLRYWLFILVKVSSLEKTRRGRTLIRLELLQLRTFFLTRGRGGKHFHGNIWLVFVF